MNWPFYLNYRHIFNSTFFSNHKCLKNQLVRVVNLLKLERQLILNE
jgi:hypothetical protein